MDKDIYLIAEAGVNHNCDPAIALEMVDVAADAGANAVKFQTFKAEFVTSETAPKAAYQSETTERNESQKAMLKGLELSPELHFELKARCDARSLDFLSTPFDIDSLKFLVEQCDIKLIKIPSGEITNGPLLLEAAKTGNPIILSTGMSTLEEIEKALSVFAFGYLHIEKEPSADAFRKAYISPAGCEKLKKNVTLLHCTTEYPAPFEDVNLYAMDTMRSSFELPVGLSDHTMGIAVAIAAAARGAVVLEKHFTLSRDLPGPDQKASLEPHELKELVQSVRIVTKALGSPAKVPAFAELGNRKVIRKGLVASRPIKQGELLTEQNIIAKRPENGISPMSYWDLLGTEAPRSFEKDESLRL